MSIKGEVTVKEEYMVEESDVDFNHLSQVEGSGTKCGEVFLDQRGDFTFVCALCLQIFQDLPNFGEHVRNCHPTSKIEPFVADFTDLPLIKSEPPDELEGHTEFPNCKMEDGGKELLSTHNEIRQDIDNSETDSNQSGTDTLKPKRRKRKTYCCLSCGKILSSFSLYRLHYHTEHPGMIEKDVTPVGSRDKKSFVPKVPEEMSCVYCLKKFVDPAIYKDHMETAHPGLIRYVCSHCPKAFARQCARDYHVDVHEGNKRFRCTHCPKAFSYPKNLQCHIRITHMNIKYMCRFCGLEFTQKSSVNIHERTHTKEKPYQCDECDKSFAAKARLTYHKKRHLKIRDYKCPHCEWAFYTSSNLNSHIAAVHTPFSCDICGQIFKVKSKLRSHQLVHFDEKKEGGAVSVTFK